MGGTPGDGPSLTLSIGQCEALQHSFYGLPVSLQMRKTDLGNSSSACPSSQHLLSMQKQLRQQKQNKKQLSLAAWGKGLPALSPEVNPWEGKDCFLGQRRGIQIPVNRDLLRTLQTSQEQDQAQKRQGGPCTLHLPWADLLECSKKIQAITKSICSTVVGDFFTLVYLVFISSWPSRKYISYH